MQSLAVLFLDSVPLFGFLSKLYDFLASNLKAYYTTTTTTNLNVSSGKELKSVFQMALKDSSFWKWKKISEKIWTPKIDDFC